VSDSSLTPSKKFLQIYHGVGKLPLEEMTMVMVA